MTVCRAIALILLVTATFANAAEQPRTWTDTKGNTTTGTFVRTTGDMVELLSAQGRPLRVHRDKLCDADWLCLAIRDPEFLNIAIDVGSISRAQRPKVDESGYVTPRMKFDVLRFRLDRRDMLTLSLNNESWRVPLSDDFWQICDHLSSSFALGKHKLSSHAWWKTSMRFRGINSPADANQVELRLRVSDAASFSWSNAKEGKDVVTILIDERGFDDLRAMPERTAKARESLRNHPRIRRVLDLLAKNIEEDKKTFSLANIEKTTDPMENATFYSNTRDCSIKLPAMVTVTLRPYIGQKQNTVNFKFKLIYTSMDWLFIKNLILLSDTGHRAVIDVESGRDSKVVDGGGILEWSDVILEPGKLLAFTNATQIACRLEGQFRKEFDMTTDQRMALLEVLTMYTKLTSK